jgi:hypothetical protein
MKANAMDSGPRQCDTIGCKSAPTVYLYNVRDFGLSSCYKHCRDHSTPKLAGRDLSRNDAEVRFVAASSVDRLAEVELDYIFCAPDVKSFVASCISVSREERFNVRIDRRTAAALVTILRAEVRGESMIDVVQKCLATVDSQIERIVFDQQNESCFALLFLAGKDEGTTIKVASCNGILLATGLRIPMAMAPTAVSDPRPVN